MPYQEPHKQVQSPQPNGLRRILRALRGRNYRLFFAGQSISLIGNFMTQVAMAWLVFRVTKSPFWLGAVFFAGQIPMFLLAPFAGVWVDRLNRQRLLIVTQTLATLQSAGLAAIALSGLVAASPMLSIWLVMVLAVAQGLINAFDMPGRQAFLVQMLDDRSDLSNAIALNSTMVHAARLIGPSSAGILIARFGEGTCFLLDAISYLGVIAALFAMRIKPSLRQRTNTSVLDEMKEGFQYIAGFAPIRVLLLLMTVVSLTAMPAFNTLMPIFGEALGHGRSGAQTMGFLMGASGVGALVGAILLASRHSVVGLGRVIATAAGIFGIGLIAFAFSHTLWLSLPIAALCGYGMITTFASTNTVLQTLAEDEKRGRVMSFFTMAFIGMAPWGSLLAGTLASRLAGPIAAADSQFIGASRTLMISGGVCLIGGVLFATKLPALRRIVRPIYVQKGILAEIATGMRTAADVAGPPRP